MMSNMAIFGTSKEAPTTDRGAELAKLEQQISSGMVAFHRAGLALEEIRRRKLFYPKHENFEAYCSSRWNMSTAHVTRLIQAAEVCANLAGLEPLPSNEAQARVLARMEPEQQREVWSAAKDTLPVGSITAEALEEVADQVAPKRKRARRRKPKAITLRGKGWSLVLTRRSADLDPAACLDAAVEALKLKELPQAKAA